MEVAHHFYAAIIAGSAARVGSSCHSPRPLLAAALLAWLILAHASAQPLAQTPAGELVDLGSGVPGLRLYSAGERGPATQSLLLADVGLLGLAIPHQQQVFDELLLKAGTDRPLLLVVSSLTAAPWLTTIEFVQDGLSVEVKHPFRLRLLSGEAELVAPGTPAVAVVLLPDEFNLRRPITVRWGEASATITFRH